MMSNVFVRCAARLPDNFSPYWLICRLHQSYEEVSLSSQSGLNEVLQLSRCGAGNGFAEAISSLGKSMPTEGVCVAQSA